jgi:hypothetical protein
MAARRRWSSSRLPRCGFRGDGLAGVGDSGGFPVGGGGRGPPGVVLAQQRRGVRGQDAELAGQPGFGAGGQLSAERARPLVQCGGELVRQGRRVLRCPMRPGHVTAQVGQGNLLEAGVQNAGNGPGAVQRRGGDLGDDSGDVVPGELGGAEPLLEDLAGMFAVVSPGFGFGEPGFDLLVDLRVQRLPDRGGPEGEQVTGSAGPFLGLADVLGGG